MSKSSPVKRIPFSDEEDTSMWMYLLGKIRKRDQDAKNLKNTIWMEHAATCKNNRSYHALEKRFRNIMLPRIYQAPISDEDIVLIIEQCKVRLENHEAAFRLKKRLKALCEFTTAPDLLVQKVVRKVNSINLDNTQASHPDTSHSTLSSGISNDDDLISDSGSNNSDSSAENDEGYRRFSDDILVSHQASPNQDLGNKRKRPYFGLKKNKKVEHKNRDITDDVVEIDKSGSVDTSSRTVPKAGTRENVKARRSSTFSQCGLEDEDEENEPRASRTAKMRLLQQHQRINSTKNKDQSLPLDDEETLNELSWHDQLVEYNKNNDGKTQSDVYMCKELLRSRIFLALKKAIPVDKILDGIPDNIQSTIKEFIDVLKWCLSTNEALPSVLEPLFANSE
ncbi:hypothetical protein Ddc_07245 [Ditylenchus destructor]|nr:hypothetical protein Ddc_07245 [Ditylenchus destructor]